MCCTENIVRAYFVPSQAKSTLHQLQAKPIQSQFRSSQVMLAPSQFKFAPRCSDPLFRPSHPQVSPGSFPGQVEADQINRRSGQTSPKSCQMSPKSSASQTRWVTSDAKLALNQLQVKPCQSQVSTSQHQVSLSLGSDRQSQLHVLQS